MNKKIVELKNKLGLSRASFARPLDISPSQMARIEAGKVVLSDEFLQKICSTFHVNLAFFTGEVDIDSAVSVVSPEEEMKQVGERLKQARLEKGLTLRELSDLVGLSDSQLCLIENGTNKLAEERAVILGEALEVGVEWLLHGKERNKHFQENDGVVERPSRSTRRDMEDDEKLNKENGRVPHYHQEKSQTFFVIKPDKEDKEENVHLKNLKEPSEDLKEDQYIDVTKLPKIRIDSSMLMDEVYHKMTMQIAKGNEKSQSL